VSCASGTYPSTVGSASPVVRCHARRTGLAPGVACTSRAILVSLADERQDQRGSGGSHLESWPERGGGNSSATGDGIEPVRGGMPPHHCDLAIAAPATAVNHIRAAEHEKARAAARSIDGWYLLGGLRHNPRPTSVAGEDSLLTGEPVRARYHRSHRRGQDVYRPGGAQPPSTARPAEWLGSVGCRRDDGARNAARPGGSPWRGKFHGVIAGDADRLWIRSVRATVLPDTHQPHGLFGVPAEELAA
jgi:hypothetical protein